MKKIILTVVLVVAVFGNLSLLNNDEGITINLNQLIANAQSYSSEFSNFPSYIKSGTKKENPNLVKGAESEDIIYHCIIEEYKYGNGEGHADVNVGQHWGTGSVDVNAGGSGNKGSYTKTTKTVTLTGVNCIPRYVLITNCIKHIPC